MGIHSRSPRPRNGLSLCSGAGGLDMGLMLAEPGFHSRSFSDSLTDDAGVAVLNIPRLLPGVIGGTADLRTLDLLHCLPDRVPSLARRQHFLRLLDPLRGHGHRPATLLAALPRPSYPGLGALTDQVALQFGKDGQQADHCLAHWAFRVDALRQAHELHAALGERFEGFEDAAQRAPEAVQLPDDELAALVLARLHRADKHGPLHGAAAGLINEDQLARHPIRLKRGDLHVGVLVMRRNSGIADLSHRPVFGFRRHFITLVSGSSIFNLDYLGGQIKRGDATVSRLGL